MRKILVLFLIWTAIYSCGNDGQVQSNNTRYDGSYCANVTYNNPNTGKQSQYTLIIDVNENNLERINFPQGWLDEDNFELAMLDADGFTSLISDKGYKYDVQVIGESNGCFDNSVQPKKCNGNKKDGTRCSRLTDNVSGFCWQHEDQQ